MDLRIGLCGAQGTGKTTLSRLLARELDLPLIEEQARVVVRELGIERPCLAGPGHFPRGLHRFLPPESRATCLRTEPFL